MKQLVLLLVLSTSVTLAAPNLAINGVQHDDEQLACQLPSSEHMPNIGSRVDGAGMCVMTSIEAAARWQGLEEYRGLREWCAKQPGGGFPQKVDKQLKEFAKFHNLPEPQYIQYEGPDPEELLKLISATRRMACVTYGRGPRYGPQTISHMVCCPNFGKHAAILDNNHIKPEGQAYEWMNTKEALLRIKHPRNTAWVFVWLAPPPPPSPTDQIVPPPPPPTLPKNPQPKPKKPI